MKRSLAVALLVALLPIPTRAEDTPPPSGAKEHWSRTYVGTGSTLIGGGVLLAVYGFMGEKHHACPHGGECTVDQDRKAARIAGVGLAAAGAGILVVGHQRERKRRSPQVGFVPGLRSGMVWVSF